jgi:hypothetical protein
MPISTPIRCASSALELDRSVISTDARYASTSITSVSGTTPS